MDRRNALRMASAGLLGSLALQAWAQPQKPVVRIIVPYAAGGITDMMARSLAQSMAKTLDRTVIVENHPGAAGLIGTRAALAAPPNGDTLIFTNPGYITLPLTNKDAKYDPVKDFTPIAMVGRSPLFLMVHESVPAKNAAELIAYAKTKPEGLETANAGTGSSGHITAAMFAKAAGIKLVHVPYKGTAETANALIAGQVKLQINATTEALNSQARTGHIRLLAVMSEKRSPLAPDVPAISETIPGFAIDTWFGFLAPAGTPATAVQKLNQALAVALGDLDVRERFKSGFIEVQHSSPDELAAAIARSTQFWRKAFAEIDVGTLR
jgi:tripartite-type tricarboxylate transporter receptor subunit TctC